MAVVRFFPPQSVHHKCLYSFKQFLVRTVYRLHVGNIRQISEAVAQDGQFVVFVARDDIYHIFAGDRCCQSQRRTHNTENNVKNDRALELPAVCKYPSPIVQNLTKRAVLPGLDQGLLLHQQIHHPLKIPFIQSTSTLPKTEMLYDLAVSDVITSDKKSMVADSFVLWRIDDPLRFIQTLSGKKMTRAAFLSSAAGMAFNCIGEPLFGYFYTAVILGAPADAAKALAGWNAITTCTNAVLTVIIASLLYLALYPRLKTNGTLQKIGPHYGSSEHTETSAKAA